MSLTHEEYDRIMREYEDKRRRARDNARQALEKVREAIPQYRPIEDAITDTAMECAAKAIDGDEKAVSVMKERIAGLVKEQEDLLKANGFSRDFLEEHYECPDCKDTGYIGGTKRCHCLRQRILRHLYDQSNIGDILERENFDTVRYDIYTDSECEQMKEIIGKCREFTDDFDDRYENILLVGSVGVGKTFLTNCMAKALLDKGHSVIYFTAIRMFDTLSRGLYNYDDDGFASAQKDLFSCDLLIIDDLGTESISSFAVARLFDILNERDIRRRSTIISTNLSFGELGERYTERSISRILGSYKVLKPDIEDIRLRLRKRQASL
ncbi:MAG: ATP-binding protein [Lachnospiraceae bacterium]|nr:ATP-binding protein [Lachnospiraceae bacterium]